MAPLISEKRLLLQAVTPPPGPRGLSHATALFSLASGDLLSRWRRFHALYGDTVRLTAGPLHVWSFASAEAVHQGLVTEHKDDEKGLGL